MNWHTISAINPRQLGETVSAGWAMIENEQTDIKAPLLFCSQAFAEKAWKSQRKAFEKQYLDYRLCTKSDLTRPTSKNNIPITHYAKFDIAYLAFWLGPQFYPQQVCWVRDLLTHNRKGLKNKNIQHDALLCWLPCAFSVPYKYWLCLANDIFKWNIKIEIFTLKWRKHLHFFLSWCFCYNASTLTWEVSAKLWWHTVAADSSILSAFTCLPPYKSQLQCTH